MHYESLLDEVEQYIKSFFDVHRNAHLLYHNIEHTENVVTASKQIADHYQLNERDYFIVLTAAWFHDTGYLLTASGHEEAGAAKAETFLQSKGVDNNTIQAIMECILVTKKNMKPDGLLKEIISDADLFHLGTDDFSKKNSLMRKECMALNQVEISKQEWRIKTIRFLENHHYYTDYCRLLLTDIKMKNLAKLKENVAKKERSSLVSEPVQQHDEMKGSEMQETNDTNSRPARGVETMFRISSSNHQRLSDMADSKANIMISVNSIIVSVLLSVLLRSLGQYPHLTFPLFLLVTVNVITIVFSVLATRPTLPKGTFTKDDVTEKKVNLLFFGNFYKMNMEDYTYGMKQMMKDKDFLYGSLIKDGYSQGVILGKKYNLLRISYNVFMFGLIASVLAFVISSLFFKT